MEKLLISACLVGDKVRYDGRGKYHPLIEELLKKYELVPFCPEVEGGLPTPRHPSEIKGEIVTMVNGKVVTKNFEIGAYKALDICIYLGIKTAILKEGSPSCGVNQINDGNFTGRKIEGSGITTRLLKRKGINVISENDIEAFLNK